jgi:hypothetical protein
MIEEAWRAHALQSAEHLIKGALQNEHEATIASALSEITGERVACASSAANDGAHGTSVQPQYNCMLWKNYSSCCKQNRTLCNQMTQMMTCSCQFPNWQYLEQQLPVPSDWWG